MTSDAFIREYAWAIALVVAVLFLVSRRVMRHLRERRELREQALAELGQTPTVGPEDYSRARKQFLLTLALLIVIVIVSLLTHFQ